MELKFMEVNQALNSPIDLHDSNSNSNNRLFYKNVCDA